jgi:hypothetical protein
MSQQTWATATLTFALGLFSVACQSGGIGDPCVPEDEYQTFFSGYAVTEVNLESKSFQCETRLCLVNHFQGRVSCPYGQKEAQAKDPNVSGDVERTLCHIPGASGATKRIAVEVKPQFDKRRPADAVYCSCRCDGPDTNSRFCKCPTGFGCTKLLEAIPSLGSVELAGSYCVKDGTAYDNKNPQVGSPCGASSPGATPPAAPGNCGLYDGQQ